MFCRKCGAPLRPEDVFCSKCGTKVIHEDNEAAVQSADPPMPQQDDAPSASIPQASAETQTSLVKDEDKPEPKHIHSSVRIKAASPYRFLACILMFVFSAVIVITEAHTLFTSPLLTGEEEPFIIIFGILAILCAFLTYRGIAYTRFNEKHYNTALQNGEDVTPYQEVNKIALVSPVSGLVKQCSTGYCWGMFWFNCLCPLFRGDLKWAFITFIGTMFLGGISMGLLFPLCGPIFAFFYNKRYIRTQLEKGFVPADGIAKRWLADKGIINI